MTDAEVKEWAYWIGSIPLRQDKPMSPRQVLEDVWKHRQEDGMSDDDQDIMRRALTLLGSTVVEHDVLPTSEV